MTHGSHWSALRADVERLTGELLPQIVRDGTLACRTSVRLARREISYIAADEFMTTVDFHLGALVSRARELYSRDRKTKSFVHRRHSLASSRRQENVGDQSLRDYRA
jgi:hypothetical protein